MISDAEYESIMRIRKEINDALSTTIRVSHDQVLELVIADLLGKYKANKNDARWRHAFEEVLRFYLTDDELFQLGIVIRNET